jgi:hypothetical protein
MTFLSTTARDWSYHTFGAIIIYIYIYYYIVNNIKLNRATQSMDKD